MKCGKQQVEKYIGALCGALSSYVTLFFGQVSAGFGRFAGWMVGDVESHTGRSGWDALTAPAVGRTRLLVHKFQTGNSFQHGMIHVRGIILPYGVILGLSA